MKKEVDSKKLLFENMSKLNPDFKLNEGDDKWIQKAVDPEHKGYCTPMTKPTCTPQRKALAKRFKKGIENEGVNFHTFFSTTEYRKKANEIKAVIDKLVFDEDDEAIDTLYRLLVKRTKPMRQATPQELTEIFDAIGKGENIEENQQLLNERLTTFATDIHSEISKIPGLKRLNLWSLANGFVGLYRYEKDGNAYEIEIRPVQVGTQKALWGNQIKKREDRNAG